MAALPTTRELVLVGGGHSHVEVLRRLAREAPPHCRLTVVVDTPVAVYSGMVPGFIAGRYSAAELEIPIVPLAERAGARLVVGRATGLDVAGRRLEVEGRPALPYDVLSFDIGSTVRGVGLPGIREHALPTRPIGRLIQRLDEVLEQHRCHAPDRPFRVVVVGGGAGGVELACCFRTRLADAGGAEPRVTLVEAGDALLGGSSAALTRRLEHAFEQAGIELRLGDRVAGAEAGSALLSSGGRLAFDVLVWATGAVAQPLFRDAGLPADRRGFVLTRPTLQVEGHDELFATGDCATLADFPATPKAGVYAVRQGPVLADNLRRHLAGRPLRRYRPQDDFLILLNLGDGTASGGKWGFAARGRWLMALKDRIDRRFIERYQPGAGQPGPETPPPAP